MSWADEMLARLEAPDNWSPARRRAEAEWAQIWCGRTGYAVTRTNKVVSVERQEAQGTVGGSMNDEAIAIVAEAYNDAKSDPAIRTAEEAAKLILIIWRRTASSSGRNRSTSS